jgi:hypothetical protein
VCFPVYDDLYYFSLASRISVNIFLRENFGIFAMLTSTYRMDISLWLAGCCVLSPNFHLLIILLWIRKPSNLYTCLYLLILQKMKDIWILLI